MNKTIFTKSTMWITAMLGMAVSAAPIEKTGPCPTLTRYAPPTSDNWSQFPQKPTSTFITNCATGTPQNCTLQNNIPAELSINCLASPPGTKIQLWASEASVPNDSIHYVQNFTFDERGRVWAVEPRSYPNTIRAAGNPSSTSDNKFTGGNDRILILADTNGDHVMDKLTVFKTGLNIPQGIEVVNGGVVISMTPYVAFFPNLNDVAGAPQILWQGMGATGNTDTHGTINTMMYGLDNWIYGHTGYDNCTAYAPATPTGGANQGTGVACDHGIVWRFKHAAIGSDTIAFQNWTSSGPNNAHGIGQMEDGQIFQSAATCNPRINHSIRRGVAPVNISGTGTNNTLYPVTGDRYIWDCSNAGGAGTASATTANSGEDFYMSRLLPAQFLNRVITCEGASKVCGMDSLQPNGSTWSEVHATTYQTWDLFASTDAWVAPILVRTGPDGALWVLDWNNYLFLHNPATPSGSGSAWNNALRTKSSNRIYRIVPTDGSTEPILNLTNATTAQLVGTLRNQNFLWRIQAQRLLIGKGYTAELGDSLQRILTTDTGVDVLKNDPVVMHAVWTLAGLKRLVLDSARWNPIMKNLLLHGAKGVRENVLKALPRTAISAQMIGDQCAADDPDAHVRLQAYVALAESPAALGGPVAGHFTGTDSYSTSASGAAGTSKLTAGTTNVRPSTCPTLHGTVPVAIGAHMGSSPRNDIRYNLRPNGFDLMPYGQLASGEMLVYDITGKVVFRSTYNSAKGEWSQKSAKGLNMSVYFYSFRGVNGDQFNGRIFMSQDF